MNTVLHSILSRSVIAIFVVAISFAQQSTAQDRRAPAALAAALEAVRSSDWAKAQQIAMPSGQVGLDVVEWHRLRSRDQGQFDDYRAFLQRNPDWPGLPLLRRRGELRILDDAPAQQVIDYFADTMPATGPGARRLIEAFVEVGKQADAEALAVFAWRSIDMNTQDENTLLRLFPTLLKQHHAARLDAMLWQHQAETARRTAARLDLGHQLLAAARIALWQRDRGVDDLIEAIPDNLKDDAGLAYERFSWRVNKGRMDDAITLMLQQSVNADALGEPSRWAERRRAYARQMMRDGKSQIAYSLASRHFLEPGSDYVDLEWLSGYIALRYLGNPELALKHFQSFRTSVMTPISLGRAGYWEGRALEAMGRKVEATTAYEFGAEFQSSYYGLLAAERIGMEMDQDLLGFAVYPDWKTAEFANSTVLSAALLLQQIGERDLAERFMRHLSEELDLTGQGQLADLAMSLKEPHIALSIAKEAASRGNILSRHYYPVTELAKRDLPIPAELALAIARRESEFDPRVISGAGARGLMQIMPGTAQAMARKTGVEYSKDRLISDPNYNAELGSAYLAQLIEEFGTAYVLVAAGYNAGPGRPRTWIDVYGDPRAADVDPVDWIEHIPFRETRDYVMRVMESLPIYRARMTGRVVPLRLSKELRGN